MEQATSSPGAPAEEEPATQYLTFLLGEEVYALDISAVREIIQHGPMTKVPMTQPRIRGVINLRGAVVPVIDLKASLGWELTQVGKKTCVIIFELTGQGERIEWGLMVDAVCEVVDIAASQIEDAPAFGGPVHRQYMRGMGKVHGRFVVIIEPNRVLNIEELIQATA